MLYGLFLLIALIFNWRKFNKEREALISSLLEAKNQAHREMILGHHFHVFIFEGFLAVLVAHLITEEAHVIGILGLGAVYVGLLILGYFLYQFLIKYFERKTELKLRDSFNQNLIKDLRVSFALIMLPILIYSIINWTFQDSVYNEWGSLWFIGILANIIFVSVLTLICTVIIMLKLMPNLEITEPEYLEIINKRAAQAGVPNLRVRWIETEVKNAFIVGLKILKFSNQTMFIGRSLRNTLTLEEFDAVVAHEIAHVVNSHVTKRVVELIKNFISIVIGCAFLVISIMGSVFIFEGEDFAASSLSMTLLVLTVPLWIFFNYSLLFDTLRSHEFEADAYAVMKLGASPEALVSALEKLTQTEIPEYLKLKRKVKEKGMVGKWLQRNFSTHPDLEMRKNFLHYKMNLNPPYNYYISSAQKARAAVSKLFQWKVAVPIGAACVLFMGLMVNDFRKGRELILYVSTAPSSEIMKSQLIADSINKRPYVGSKSLMYHIVMRRDPVILDHFLQNGADKARTLNYISELNDIELFRKYYGMYQANLTESEYFLILRKTAIRNFKEGYSYLVSTDRFQKLGSEYKTDIAKIQKKKTNRLPASIKE